MMSVPPVMIMAGGTGGHVFPALAVADELRNKGIPVIWLGTRNGIEARLVPEAGYPIEWLAISGWRGKGLVNYIITPFHLIFACIQAAKVIFQRKPCAVLGMGGFASGPGGLMAWLFRKPLLIHEQNAVAGLTNRVLAHLTKNVMEAFPDSFTKKVKLVGNPVRKDILELPSPEKRFSGRGDASLRLLVIGGSLGATRLNEIVPKALAAIPADTRPQVIHQSGRNNFAMTEAAYKALGVEALVKAFVDDMSEAYAWADLVICRAGAMTVYELAAAGVGSILVPYPFAVDDHQTENALFLERAGAAAIIQQHDLTSEILSELIQDLTNHREHLLEMANAARHQAKPAAAIDVANECMMAGGLA